MFSFRETAGPFHIMFVLFYTPTVMVHESSSCSIIFQHLVLLSPLLQPFWCTCNDILQHFFLKLGMFTSSKSSVMVYLLCIATY